MTLGRRVKAEPGAKVVRTCAPLSCGPGCGLLAHVKDGVLVKVEPGDFPGTSHVCAKCLSAVKWVYHLTGTKMGAGQVLCLQIRV